MALDSATFQIPARGSFSDSESDGDLDNEPLLQSPTPREKGRFLRTISLLYWLTILSTIIFLYLTFIGVPWDSAAFLVPGQSDYCKNPTLRREWRTLSIPERLDYLTAVQCLGRQPSRLSLNHSLYDDFPWVHSHMGNFSHNTPAFIAWHRYFLNIYERALQEQCNYKGHLAYWDWSLDWVDMANSPIWDSITGFGGDGDKNAERSVGHGHCITDGPFANQTVLFFGVENRSHCLSRGFIHGKHLQTIFGSKVKPEALEAVLLEDDYESFNLQLEEGPHNAIPRAIRGDFLRVTAPNDPVFFLHHTQLDRMWWQWQQRDLRQRLWQYQRASNEGNGEYQESQEYSLNDDFHFGGLAPDRKVSDIMSTESELLCYRY